jgi:type IV pilus assembly protein PilF
MKSKFLVLLLIVLVLTPLAAQNKSATSGIDLMLMQGDYYKAIDTCKQILVNDSLNPEIHYRLGIAYQNTLDDDLSLKYFYNAATLSPGNRIYDFTLAKAYYGRDKFNQAEPVLQRLYEADSTNWLYAYYLTGIYMQSNRYDEAIDICGKFLIRDSLNTLYIDKIAFAHLKKENFSYATELYNKSLSINENSIPVLKNLAYLYSLALRSDTSIQLLTRAIAIDSTDTDLYIRRAALYYSKHYTKRALDDYLVVLASGDSSKLYLKRIGIGYCNNLQPEEGIRYLLQAYGKDSSDYETCSYLGQSYYNLQNMKKSIYYYDKVISILTPVSKQLGLTYILYAESQKGGGMYKEAVKSYLKSLDLKPDPNIYMIVGNICDEKLNDRGNAIYYYQKFLDNLNDSRMTFTREYLDTVRERLEYLKANPGY